MAEKLLVNDDVEMLGVLVDVDVEDFVDVVFEELPHAATPKQAVTASAVITALLFSKCTITSLSFLMGNAPRSGPGRCDLVVSTLHTRPTDVNEALKSLVRA